MSKAAGNAEGPPVSKRPKGDAFRQQKMTAWQPLMTPLKVVVVFLAIGVAFIPTGVTLMQKSADIFDKSIIYDGNGAEVDCGITKPNAGKTCSVQFQIDKDLPSTTLYVYYQLSNFYQNHRRYVGSLSTAQLQGNPVDRTVLETACDPLPTNGSTILSPCGLIANSLFNDKITFVKTQSMSMKETDIAWESDKKKFAQPKGFMYKQWSTYDEFTKKTCADAGLPGDCRSYEDKGNSGDPTKYYFYYYPNDDTIQYLYETYPNIISPIEGVTNEHFMVWMRTASLPTFRKLYGTIQGSFVSGEKLTFNINANFEVASFKGTKAIVISTVNDLGGRNNFLGVAYVVVGSLSMLLGILFASKSLISPRPIGDEDLLHWT